MGIHIARIHVKGFKRFTTFDLSLNPSFNVIVGDNETGKSSLLEAIGLVLTGHYDGRLIQYAIDPYLFNAATVAAYFQRRQSGSQAPAPKISIEAYFDHDNALARLKGTNNTRNEDCPGLKLEIEVDNDHVDSLKDYAADKSNPSVLPTEFYRATWRSFAGNSVMLKNLPFRATAIDTSRARIYRGPYQYLSGVIRNLLDDDQRCCLSLAYKKLQHQFAQEQEVLRINERLRSEGNIATAKTLTVQMDMSTRASWDSAITPHLDDLPFDCAGKGEQCRVQTRLAIAAADKACVLLIEEPENHLSPSHLNAFVDDLKRDCADRQVIVTTHSAFVLNKLGIDALTLLSHRERTMTFAKLSRDTRNYFMKLPGYETLRLILSQSSILVEGPSDELIVQRAYKDRYGRLPIENGVEVISVGSLAFRRFLEIAELLELPVCVVTDNDKNVAALECKYAKYRDSQNSTIRVAYDTDPSLPTLEPQLLNANSLPLLNAIFGTTYRDEKSLLKYMADNKTDCALKMFETTEAWTAPQYISYAIE